MYLAVVALHIILSVILVFVILLQPGKGGDIGASFAGSSNAFGPRGPTSLLARATTIVAVLFMVTSVTLAWYSNKEILANADVLDEIERKQQERAEKEAAEAAVVPAPTEAIPMEIPAEGAPVDGAPTETPAADAPPAEGTPAP